MKYDKSFKTFSEQIEILKKRGLLFNDVSESDAENILSHINYYKFSNYIKTFEISTDKYHKTDFNDALNLYKFDRTLSRILFDLVEKIEISFKTSLAYSIAEHIENKKSHTGNAVFDYLDIKNWHDLSPKNKNHSKSNQIANSNELLDRELEFKSTIFNYCKKNSRECVESFFTKYSSEHFVPIWLLMEIVDFGVACKMYENAATSIKTKISQKYNILRKDFYTYIKTVKFIRNKLAHNSTIWNLNLINKINKPLITSISKDVDNGRIFAVIIVIIELMKTIEPTYDYTILRDLINNFFLDYHQLLYKFGIKYGNYHIVNQILK